MITKKVSPTSITNTDARNLHNFFYSPKQSNTSFWPQGTKFIEGDIQYELPYSIVRRARKEGKQGERFEFLPRTPMDTGCYDTKVYLSVCTMAVYRDKIEFSKISQPAGVGGKTRVIKVVPFTFFNERSVQKEYQMTLQSGTLHIKPPTISNRVSYTVMKTAPGKNLYEILTKDTPLTVTERLELTEKLLLAVKQNVTDKKIIHADLKPENIIVNRTKPLSVTIIDFGLSKSTGDKNETIGGTEGYAAPELYRGLPLTPKADVFALGIILGHVWSDSTKDLNKETENALSSLVKAMSAENLFLRCSIDEAISRFQSDCLPPLSPAPAAPAAVMEIPVTPPEIPPQNNLVLPAARLRLFSEVVASGGIKDKENKATPNHLKIR